MNIGATKSYTIPFAQVFDQAIKQIAAILCPLVTLLLILHDMLPDSPIGK